MPFMAPVLIWSSDYAVFSEQALVFSGKYIIFSYSCKIGLHFILRLQRNYTFKYWVILINYMYLLYG